MVFAAGLGTRLRPLTERLPKPVVPLMNRPLAAYSLERLAAVGVKECAVNTHHLADAVVSELEGWVPDGTSVRFVHEPTLLGTGGGLRNGLMALGAHEGDPDAPIVVMNGDIFFWPDLEGALALHEELGAVATMVLRPDPRAKRLGAVEIDTRGEVRRLLGTPASEEVFSEYMFTGVHVLRASAIADLPEEGCVIRRAYRHWIDGDAVVAGFVDESPWRDLGTPAEYLRAHLDLLDGTLTWPGLDPEIVSRGEGAEVASDAHVSNVTLGPGSRVEAGVRLERAVVWGDTVVSESASDVIVAPHARVDVRPPAG